MDLLTAVGRGFFGGSSLVRGSLVGWLPVLRHRLDLHFSADAAGLIAAGGFLAAFLLSHISCVSPRHAVAPQAMQQ